MVHAGACAALALLVACSPGGPATQESPESPERAGLVVQPANYELVAGEESRFIAGLLTEDNLFVSGGEVDMRFAFLGEEGAEPEPFGETVGSFLHIDEGHGPPPDAATVGPPSIGRGVYATEMTFDRPGVWQVEIEAATGEGSLVGTGAFTVLEEAQVPAPGEEAPPSENLVLGQKGAPAEAVDSRAGAGTGIPDPELHGTTIADAIAAKRPALVVFSTPVYCVSKFCGPVTDVVAGFAEEFADRAAFIHVEIWRDFQGQVVNEAAAEWLQTPDGGLTEPWVFLIGPDGRIVSRWDNVATREEIEPALRDLLR